MHEVTIHVARDYSSHPIGRERENWPFGGERFREDFLEPRLRENTHVLVDLRGVRGLAPSFLEEAFGGLIDAHFKYDFLRDHLTIVADGSTWERQVWKYVRNAAGLAADE